MAFRARLILSFVLVSAIPIIVLAYLVRTEMSSRITRQYEDQIDATVTALAMELGAIDREVSDRLAALKQSILNDNRFRLALVQPGSDRSFLIDYAESALALNGLSALQIQDASGRIVSSGHFRNEFDRLDDRLVPQLRRVRSESDAVPLVATRMAEGSIYVAARADSLRIGDRAFTVVTGREIRSGLLAGLKLDAALNVSIALPDGKVLSATADDSSDSDAGLVQTRSQDIIERSFTVPFVDEDRALSNATVFVRYELGELRALRARIDRWVALVVALTGILAILLVFWNASRLSRPLADLARRAGRVDLDRLDVDFTSDRNDEVGRLSGVLGRMVRRLRTSTVSLREAERRATVGDLARQVNHDVKNGLIPIRNIVRHLSGLSKDDPDALVKTFEERLPALNDGISYLDSLSTNYGRLSQPSEKTMCDVAHIARRIAGDYNAGAESPVLVKDTPCPPVPGDPVALRRIVENLIKNGVESLENGSGNVTVEVGPDGDDEPVARIRISVSDTGVGMTEEQKRRLFENFFTTKETGTGLGLSIVRRLIMDLGGSITVESESGKGSRFEVVLPVLDPSSLEKTL